MGLDMYFMKKKKINRKSFSTMSYNDWSASEVGYLRKVNCIHKWLVDNVQKGNDDCRYHIVKKEKIEELLKICNQILEESILIPGKMQNGTKYDSKTEKWEPIYQNGLIIANKELCEELLPTQDGFFFGSQEYDEYYYEDIKETKKILEDILEHTDFEEENIYYCSSW